MLEINQKSDKKFQLYGWFLFILSALFFIAASIKTGDMLGLLGGVFFLIACFVFLVPFLRPTFFSGRD